MMKSTPTHPMRKLTFQLLAVSVGLSGMTFAQEGAITGKITLLTEKVELYPFQVHIYTQPTNPIKFPVEAQLEDGKLTFVLPGAANMDPQLQPMFLNGNMDQCTKNLNENAEMAKGVVIDALYFTRPNNQSGILDLTEPNSKRSGSWMYVKDAQVITGRVDCPGISFVFDLNLLSGWNTLVTTTQMQNNTMMVTQVTEDTSTFSWQIKQ